MFAIFAILVFLTALYFQLSRSYRRTRFVPPASSMRNRWAFGGQYWTLTQGLAAAGAALVTFTHSLSITPSQLFARVFLHQTALTATGWPQIGIIGTNVVSVAIPVAQTNTLLDVEVGMQHSLVS